MDFYKLLGIPECDVEILKGTYTKTNNFDPHNLIFHCFWWQFKDIPKNVNKSITRKKMCSWYKETYCCSSYIINYPNHKCGYYNLKYPCDSYTFFSVKQFRICIIFYTIYSFYEIYSCFLFVKKYFDSKLLVKCLL